MPRLELTIPEVNALRQTIAIAKTYGEDRKRHYGAVRKEVEKEMDMLEQIEQKLIRTMGGTP